MGHILDALTYITCHGQTEGQIGTDILVKGLWFSFKGLLIIISKFMIIIWSFMSVTILSSVKCTLRVDPTWNLVQWEVKEIMLIVCVWERDRERDRERETEKERERASWSGLGVQACSGCTTGPPGPAPGCTQPGAVHIQHFQLSQGEGGVGKCHFSFPLTSSRRNRARFSESLIIKRIKMFSFTVTLPTPVHLSLAPFPARG